MTTTYIISIPPKFWSDHASRCIEREVPITKKGKRIVVELTGDEVADLHSDSVHYSDSGDFDFEGASALASSARATRKAIETQVPNIAQLRAQWRANQDAARRAWEQSEEGQRALAETEARREASRLREINDPPVNKLAGRRVRCEATNGEWVTVRSVGYHSPSHLLDTLEQGTIAIRSCDWGARISQAGIELAPLD